MANDNDADAAENAAVGGAERYEPTPGAFEILGATNPRAAFGGKIDLLVQFYGFSGPIPFTASQDDDTAHGRLLYESALAGEYGQIAPLDS